jgi:hypothetical protein
MLVPASMPYRIQLFASAKPGCLPINALDVDIIDALAEILVDALLRSRERNEYVVADAAMRRSEVNGRSDSRWSRESAATVGG